MSVFNPALENAFLNWISTFDNLSYKPDNFESLSDGIILTEVMHNVESDLFEPSKINRDTQDNWALRFANVSYLYEGLENFYSNVLDKFFDKAYIDIAKVTNNDGKSDLYNLVGLVLVAAVKSPNKEVYINAILGLDETCQNSLMDMIDKVLHRFDPVQEQTNQIENDMAQRPSNIIPAMKVLEAQEKHLLTKVDELEKENQLLKERLGEMDQEAKEHKIKENEFIFEIEKKSEEVKRLLQERENMQIIADAQESIEELRNELKLKDHKLEQLDEFIEELKHKNEGRIAKYEDEIDKQKKKITDLIKIEGTMNFYEQKYQEYSQLTVKITETEEELQKYKSKLDDTHKLNEALQSKFNTYKEKLETEKTKNISLDLELTKKKAEIEGLKKEKERLSITNADIEKKLHDSNRDIEKYKREQEDNLRHYANTDKAMNELAGQNFLSMGDEERQRKPSVDTLSTAAANDGEKEILQQENKILRDRCKEIQVENESLKGIKEDETKNREKLEGENNQLKEEVNKLKTSSSSNTSVSNSKLEGEIEGLKKQLREAQEAARKKQDNEDVSLLKDELNEKSRLITQLNEQIVGYKGASDKTKILEDEVTKKNEEIKELNDQLETMNGILTEVGDQKEDELKVLAAAIQELAIRNLDLEKQVNSRGDLSGTISMAKVTHATAVTQGSKTRK